MSMELFKHNADAYASAVTMMHETGKAAIIHPTGTGKSFIGFKLCEEHPASIICWLSPSEYIFKTQVENLKATGVCPPANIRFFTYAKLMYMSEQERKEIQPAYIILDEFHRCGADMWGQGVQELLRTYPEVPILGLSATAIRYLDHQRDMADELFDGHIASEMTLGQAIVRGILHAPTYVLSIYAYQKELERYQRRIRRAKNQAVRDEAEQCLEALRRALDKADGLDDVFAKHMTDTHGKYLMFCANYAHLCDMVKQVPVWFSKVDPHPHVYAAYSNDPETSDAFADFKKDTSDHLKLLFCIDMLNEGIHVEDVSGVVLLRPTVSPIIYKQQIGRALSASKKNRPVIFDIVLNIENLYSIGALEEEIKVAMTYYRSRGMQDNRISGRFQVVDEVRDCRVLFEKLNETLTASWDLMYEKAKQYYQKEGHLDVPKKYKTSEGYSLGSWIAVQRRVKAGEQYGTLTEERVEKLNGIGMIWDGHRDVSWRKHFASAKAYYETFGNLNVPVAYVDEQGLCLGRWISNLRTAHKSGLQRHYLTEERKQELDDIGMIWDVPDYLWQQYYAACLAYARKHGNLDIPLSYVTPDGVRLGAWIHHVRTLSRGTETDGRLTNDQIRALDELGMIWNRKQDRQWEKGYQEAFQYRKEHGNLDVPSTYVSASTYPLGKWVLRQRENAKLSEHQRKRLDDIGMIWKKPDSWETRYALAKAYYEENGNLHVPAKYVVEGVWLSKWVNEQRQVYLGRRGEKRLTDEQIARLTAIGMAWEGQRKQDRQVAWEAQRYHHANEQIHMPH